MSAALLRAKGQRLARSLSSLQPEHPYVLAIPRGGVVIAETVARAFAVPFDVILASKVRTSTGIAIGSVAEGAAIVLDDVVAAAEHLTAGQVADLFAHERIRQDRLLAAIRGAWPLPPLAGRTVIVVDDAVISGLTMRAALSALAQRRARRVVVASPLGTAEAIVALAAIAHDVVFLETLPAPAAAQLHERRHLGPPIGDAEIHELIVRELHDVGADPFAGLAIDGA